MTDFLMRKTAVNLSAGNSSRFFHFRLAKPIGRVSTVGS